jgi:acetyl esterase/lipase/transposase-like protein
LKRRQGGTWKQKNPQAANLPCEFQKDSSHFSHADQQALPDCTFQPDELLCCPEMRPRPELHYSQTCGIVFADPDSRSEAMANLARLDLYYIKDDDRKKPVVVYVHGGGWITGDKSELRENAGLLEYFLKNGYIVAAVNFRLLRNRNFPDATYKDQANDIAEALKWLVSNIEVYGGLPADFVLLGFSSGAHLAALIALNGNYLSRQDLKPDLIKAVIALDVHAYDIPAAIACMKGTPLQDNIALMTLLFGERRELQDLASPITYAGNPHKRFFFLLSSGKKGRIPQTVSRDLTESFRKHLGKHGHWAVHEHLGNRNHESMLTKFGTRDDGVSERVQIFLDILAASREWGSQEDEPQLLQSAEADSRHSPAFKLNAVLRADSPENRIGDVAREIRVRVNDIYAWRKLFEPHREMNSIAEKGRLASKKSALWGGANAGDTGKRYSDHFKQEALRLIESSGKPAIRIARELGVPINLLYQWKKDGERQRGSHP